MKKLSKLHTFKKIRLLVLSLLISIAGCAGHDALSDRLVVGFDIDDTLLFSTPAFEKGFQSKERPFSQGFWEIVNFSDEGNSVIKKTAALILEDHRSKGADIYVITARHPPGSTVLKKFLKKNFGIEEDRVFFETEGKTMRLKSIGVDIFYGDSDSDITAALEAGAIPYRIMRAPESSYRKKYNPGKYRENIIKDSEW
ncbi:MAG: HAD family acid phosphatase [Elusimicrobiota bacterium]